MDIKQFLQVASALPSGISLLLRGDHGIGKSSVAAELGRVLSKTRNIPGLAICIDRRLSQMSEGDLLGLPSVADGVTRFCPPDWLMEACMHPRLLLLDELNRATQEVMQAAFQLVLDRELCGQKLHPDTIVISAINTSGKYNVNEVDPALLDRFFVVDLTPSDEDWFDWALNKEFDNQRGGHIPPVVVSFLRANSKFLDPAKETPPMTVGTSRRSWGRFGVVLGKLNLDDEGTEENKTVDARIHPLALGFLGNEAAQAFYDFVKNRDKRIKPEDVLDHWSDSLAKRIKEAPLEKVNALIRDVYEYIFKQGGIEPHQLEATAALANIVPAELVILMWQLLANPALGDAPKHNKKWTVILHPAIAKRLVEVYSEKETDV